MSDLIARFEDVDMEIIDHEGERWVTVKQLSDALGYDDHRALIKLIDRHPEEFEGKTFVVKLTTNSPGRPDTMIINYHGVLRVGMISDAPKAPRFRDWAERVLYSVMTTGRYEELEFGRPRERPWVEKLTTQERFEMFKMRFKLAQMLVKHPEEDVLHGLLSESFGDEGALAQAIYDRAARIHRQMERQRKARVKRAPQRPAPGTFFDRNPECRAFIRPLFEEYGHTYAEMQRRMAETFGEEKTPSVTTIANERKVWIKEYEEARKS